MDQQVRGPINPFALVPFAKSNKDVERIFGMSWSELLQPEKSPLWRQPDEIAEVWLQNYAAKNCATQPRQCPWMPPDPTANHMVEGARGTFMWNIAGRFMPGIDWFDPVQGLVPNCHFIASLQAMAMTMPATLQNISREIGPGHREFTLFDGVMWKKFTTNELVPAFLPNGQSYKLTLCASSSRASESQLVGQVVGWPGVFEKVFAGAGLNTAHQAPNLLLPSYWVPSSFSSDGLPYMTVSPLVAMTGKSHFNHWIDEGTISNLGELIRSVCGADGRVKVPAWLGTKSVMHAERFDSVAIVPEHAYSLCGTIFLNGRTYIVLRNTWGKYQPQDSDTLTGSWASRELGQGGLFAWELSRVHNWFARLVSVTD